MKKLGIEGDGELEAGSLEVLEAPDAFNTSERKGVFEEGVPEPSSENSEENPLEKPEEHTEKQETKKGYWRKLREYFGGEKVENFYEARDIEGKVASSEVFKNRELLLERDRTIGAELAAIREQHETGLSRVRQVENKIKDAEHAHKLRLDLAKAAGVEKALAIQEKYEATLEVHKQEKVFYEAEVNKVLLLQTATEEKRKQNGEAIEAENTGLRSLVEADIDKVKAGTNYEERKLQAEAQRTKIEVDEKEYTALSVELTKKEAVVSSAIFSDVEKAPVLAQVKLIRESLGVLNVRLTNARGAYFKMSEGLSVVERRIAAIKGVEAKLGFVGSHKKEEDKKSENKTATTVPVSTSGGVSFISAEEKFDDKSSFEYQKVRGEGERLLSLLGKVPQDEKNISSYIKEVLDLSNVLHAYLGNEYPQLRIALLDLKKSLGSKDNNVKGALSKFIPVVKAVFDNNFNQ